MFQPPKETGVILTHLQNYLAITATLPCLQCDHCGNFQLYFQGACGYAVLGLNCFWDRTFSVTVRKKSLKDKRKNCCLRVTFPGVYGTEAIRVPRVRSLYQWFMQTQQQQQQQQTIELNNWPSMGLYQPLWKWKDYMEHIFQLLFRLTLGFVLLWTAG